MSGVNKKMNVPQLRQEFKQLSNEYEDVMTDYEGILRQYRQLLEISQQMVKEVNQLATYQEAQRVAGMAEKDWEQYYQKVGKAIEVCCLLGKAIGQGTSLNGLIGHYLVGAKREAAAIIEKAKNQVSLFDKTHLKVEEELKKRNQYILELKQTIRDYQEKEIAEPTQKLSKAGHKISDDDYAKKVRQDADRYSRQRKLMADDQVQFAKKEIDEYMAKRQEILQ